MQKIISRGALLFLFVAVLSLIIFLSGCGGGGAGSGMSALNVDNMSATQGSSKELKTQQALSQNTLAFIEEEGKRYKEYLAKVKSDPNYPGPLLDFTNNTFIQNGTRANTRDTYDPEKYLCLPNGTVYYSLNGTPFMGSNGPLIFLATYTSTGDRKEIPLTDITAKKAHFLVFAGCSPDVPNRHVGTITMLYKDGTTNQLELTMGTNVAEWAYDRPELQGHILHSKVPSGYDFSTTEGSSYQYNGHFFYVSIDLQEKELTSMALSMDSDMHQQGDGYFDLNIAGMTLEIVNAISIKDAKATPEKFNPSFNPPDNQSVITASIVGNEGFTADSISWNVVINKGSTLIKTFLSGTGTPGAGPWDVSETWDGKNDSGVFAGVGEYTFKITATATASGKTMKSSASGKVYIVDKKLEITEMVADPSLLYPGQTTTIKITVVPSPENWKPTVNVAGVLENNSTGAVAAIEFPPIVCASPGSIEVPWTWGGSNSTLLPGSYTIKVELTADDCEPVKGSAPLELAEGSIPTIPKVKRIEFKNSLPLYGKYNQSIIPVWEYNKEFKGVVYLKSLNNKECNLETYDYDEDDEQENINSNMEIENNRDNKKATIKVIFKLNQAPITPVTYTIRAESEDRLITVKKPKDVAFSSSESTAEFELILPQNIRKIDKLTWYCKKAGDYVEKKMDEIDFSKDNNFGGIYITLTNPWGIMKKTLRIEPLYIACINTEGLTDKNEVRKQLVSGVWTYLKTFNFQYVDAFHLSGYTFDLSLFYYDDKSGDCRDAAILYHLCCASLGVKEHVRYIIPKIEGQTFTTHSVMPFNDPRFPPNTFNKIPGVHLHMIGERSGKIFDPTYKYEQIPEFVTGQNNMNRMGFIEHLVFDMKPKNFKWENISITEVK